MEVTADIAAEKICFSLLNNFADSAGCCIMQKFCVKDHEPGLLLDGNWNMVWNDEFNGTELDKK